jgi:hypothetical protein
VNAPNGQQHAANRKLNEMNAVEQSVVQMLNDSDFIDKLFVFVAMEENKGSDLFNAMSFGLFSVSFVQLVSFY